MIYRFGPVPNQFEDLFITERCRKLAVQLGFERMRLKDHSLKCYFINRPDSPYFESETFKSILSFLQTETNKGRLKQVGKLFLLIVDNIRTMEEIHSFLKRVNEFVQEALPANASLWSSHFVVKKRILIWTKPEKKSRRLKEVVDEMKEDS